MKSYLYQAVVSLMVFGLVACQSYSAVPIDGAPAPTNGTVTEFS
jgi:hypothetical protein